MSYLFLYSISSYSCCVLLYLVGGLLTENKKELKPLSDKEIQRYYSTYFSSDHLIDTIGLSGFKNREFGFLLNNGYFVRNRGFSSPSQLIEYMSENSVRGAYIGSVYNSPPSPRNPIQKLTWRFKELIFDIDMDDYGPVRTCECKGPQVCDICFTLLTDAMNFLTESLTLDFGISTLYWTFSGRRGIHAWITEPNEISLLHREQRQSIIDYLTLIHDKKHSQRLLSLTKQSLPFNERVYHLFIPSFVKYADSEQLKELNLSQARIKKLKLMVEEKPEINGFELLPQIPKKHVDEFIRAVISNRAPRIDAKVSLDMRRILRMPGSIHEKTGNLCHFIPNFRTFTLNNTVSARDILEETVSIDIYSPQNACIQIA